MNNFTTSYIDTLPWNESALLLFRETGRGRSLEKCRAILYGLERIFEWRVVILVKDNSDVLERVFTLCAVRCR